MTETKCKIRFIYVGFNCKKKSGVKNVCKVARKRHEIIYVLNVWTKRKKNSKKSVITSCHTNIPIEVCCDMPNISKKQTLSPRLPVVAVYHPPPPVARPAQEV